MPPHLGLVKDCIKNSSGSRWRHKRVRHAFDFEFWASEKGELAPDFDGYVSDDTAPWTLGFNALWGRGMPLTSQYV